MSAFARPRLVVSRCLGFEACRWNAIIIAAPVAQNLARHAEVVTPCPEVEIGLGVPRDPIRLVGPEGAERLLQPATGRDVTDAMRAHVRRWLAALGPVDGFLLKSGSPSCGLGGVKRYVSAERGSAHHPTRGLFGRAVTETFPDTPAEDDGRLRNFTIRERFLTAVFTLAAWRAAKAEGTARALVDFHTRHKELLRLQQPSAKEALGRVVALQAEHSAEAAFAAYEPLLRQALLATPRREAAVNVLEHMLGRFKTILTPDEKAVFLALLSEFRQEKVPLSAPLSVIRAWAARAGDDWLRAQSFLQPYPDELRAISDSGKGRVY